MSKRLFKMLFRNFLFGTILLSVVLITWLPVFAGTHMIQTDKSGLDKNKKIHITANRLVMDTKEKCAVFIGNVRAIQENTVITSDRLKVFYNKDADKKNSAYATSEMIKKIVATGNVIIKFDDKTATSRQAVYTIENRELILSGKESKIIKDGNSITGEKIIFNRETGQINVESGNEKRVEAFFYSDDKGIK